jgi:HD superfamily phosphodiesterase
LIGKDQNKKHELPATPGTVKHNVTRFFKAHGDQKFVYHNLEHTESVVSNAGQIARHYQLEEKDFFIVMTAAWFHDAGYLAGGSADHEMRGAGMAHQIFKGKPGG